MQANETLPLQTVRHEPLIKDVRPISFLFFKTRTKVNELGSFVGAVARELFRDAVMNDMEITGPVYWNYFGFDGDESKSFVLEIALPVADLPKDYSGKFQLKRGDYFRCVSLLHEGSWYEIPKSYARLMKYLEDNQLKSGTENREIYINVDFINPEANITEIQIGIL